MLAANCLFVSITLLLTLSCDAFVLPFNVPVPTKLKTGRPSLSNRIPSLIRNRQRNHRSIQPKAKMEDLDRFDAPNEKEHFDYTKFIAPHLDSTAPLFSHQTYSKSKLSNSPYL